MMDKQARSILETLKTLAPKLTADADDALWLINFRYQTALLQTFSGQPQPIYEITHRIAGTIPVRLYRPRPGRLPMLFHIHGGGAIAGSLDVHDAPLRLLAKATGWLVVAPDYRLAPEHRFPTQIDDCYEALVAMAADAMIDPARIVVSGDSIGGTIATGLAMLAGDRRGPHLAGQILLYPNTDLRAGTSYPSRQSEDGNIIAIADLERQIRLYLASDADRNSPLASPILGDHLHKLPPAFIATAEYDPLRDEGETYANRLQDAAVTVTQHRYAGAIHAFLQMGGHTDATAKLLSDLTFWLHKK